ncbi:MAG TPA: cysteine--tRNA ligase [Anaerolineae bacterium]|nr:cysteine--tRNA ligase [Anaerolineae bacterium]
MSIQVYNVLTRRKEEFVPINPNLVTMYVCGPTVYDHAHIGHAKTYVSFDVIVRYLRFRGYRVRYVQNITDVGHILDTGEDRILKGARRDRVEPMEVVETYTRSYFEDMDALGVVRPDISPRASAHIPEQIELVKMLIEKGSAYEVEGSVYFSVPSFPDYGKLSGRRLEEEGDGARAGTPSRVALRQEKRHPADFALWKKAEPEHILRWPSPWGWGYPGWHVECSAMSTKYLGGPFDIHGGGIDNIFPHNECEIAQWEAATSKPFANYWMLAGSLTLEDVKMSKSLGNVLTIKDALKRYSPQAIRFFILSSHYSNPIDFSDAAVEAAEKGVERLLAPVRAVRDRLRTAADASPASEFVTVLDEHRAAFVAAMDDNFNAPAALGAMSKLTTDVNTLLNSGQAIGKATLEAIDRAYRDLGHDVLGIVPATLKSEANLAVLDGVVQVLIRMRAEARAGKDFARADTIRTQLAEAGIALEDGRDGTVWRMTK